MAAFFGLILAGAITLLPRYGPGAFVAYSVVLTLLLVIVCWLTGEPPRWR